MDWADELASQVEGRQVVNDSKTPSGTVHIGSLRGPVILDVIVRALRARGLETTLLYGIDDMDPMDAQALLTPDAIDRFMGAPLAHIPDQVEDGHASYARHHAQVFIDIFSGLGIHPDRYYWMSDIYPTGDVDPYIRLALDRADRVREIYRRVANVNHPDRWLPVSVVCPNCGKIGTTFASDWDGETIGVACKPDLVQWARGCGWTGRVAPWKGAAKLPWNLEWAAQWSLFEVTIEPSGKDLSTRGGSRDRSDAIAREVFEREPPLNLAYEFLNIGGKKMSTSKGLGAAAHTMAEVLPPEQVRFLFVRHRPESVIEFVPAGTDAIPRLFDEFDRLARATAGFEVKGELPSGFAEIFAYSLLDPEAEIDSEAEAYRPPFAHLALLAQVPGVDLIARIEAEKGSPLEDRERAILDERLGAVRRWLEDYAPEQAVVRVRETLPEEADALDADQRGYLAALADAAAAALPTSGDAWQAQIFGAANERGLDGRRAFAALYLAFLGRPNGPRAGWLLAGLDAGFVLSRLREAARPTKGGSV